MSRPVQRDSDERIASRVDVGGGQNCGDARGLFRSFDVDGAKPGMGMGTAHDASVQHARQLDVVDESAVPAE
jgi:hypothetical protein